MKVAIPSTPADAKGLLAAAIRDPDPVVVLEPKLHYRTMRGEVPEGEHVVPLGKARLAREGTDLTLVAYGSMVPLAEQAADELAGEASVEVLDIRTLKPLDEEALLASAAKTGRVVIVQEAPRTAGYGAELAAILAEKAILDLHGPVLRVTGYDVPYPYWQIEDAYMPSVERVRPPRASCSSSEDAAVPDRHRAARPALLGAARRGRAQGGRRLEPRPPSAVDAVGARTSRRRSRRRSSSYGASAASSTPTRTTSTGSSRGTSPRSWAGPACTSGTARTRSRSATGSERAAPARASRRRRARR